MTSIKLALAQINCLVGDIQQNLALIIEYAQRAIDQQADVILFPECAISGYPADDLLCRATFIQQCADAIAELNALALPIHLVIGEPRHIDKKLYNTLNVYYRGQCLTQYAKRCLPNTGLFDERRYFQPGNQTITFQVKGIQFGLLICEDLWHDAPLTQLKAAGAQAVLVANASPFYLEKHQARDRLLNVQAKKYQMPILYSNLIGGQDEYLFDGHSCAVDQQGCLITRLPFCQSALGLVSLNRQLSNEVLLSPITESHPVPSPTASLYQALVLGLRDYVHKNGLQHVILGLSGGIDSALTLAIAVDALGAKYVTAVMMPSQYTSDISLEDAQQIADTLQVQLETRPIDAMVQLASQGFSKNITLENIQARCRTVLLMAMSNETGQLLMACSNKSELAVGYTTIYGDMAGAYSVLKDVYKTQVFELARYRNQLTAVIPERTITRPPSAELALHQQDIHSLPEYAVVDGILDAYFEKNQDQASIIALGYAPQLVQFILQRVHTSEYKRYQAAPGPVVSLHSFGRTHRFPITSNWALI